MLNIIHTDHKNIMQLLLVLEDKISLLKNEQAIDYQLIKSITSYLKKYADKYHHPMENLIYAYYLKYRVVEERVGTRLVDEHKQLKLMTEDVNDMLEMIMLDAIMPKERVIEKLETFLSLQRKHLIYEETEVLPQIAQTLTEDDWEHLNLQWQHHKYVDPLFGKKISEQFKALSEYIKQAS